MSEIIFYSVLLVAGLALIFGRPLARSMNLPIYWEVGAGSLLIIAFLFFLTEGYETRITEEDLAKRPCGTDSPQGACYSLERGLCEKAWDNADRVCKTEVANVIKDRPSALLGPIMNRCKAKKMDQFLRYNRAKTDSPFCKAYFEFIEAR
jgi:hypothetical protein